VLLGNGDGTFQTATASPTYSNKARATPLGTDTGVPAVTGSIAMAKIHRAVGGKQVEFAVSIEIGDIQIRPRTGK
jgi:hypothetical protein